MPADQITVYGTDWCHDTKATRAQLTELGIPFRYVNIELDPEADAWVREQNGGKRKMPTVDLGNTVLSVPDEEELMEALRAGGRAG